MNHLELVQPDGSRFKTALSGKPVGNSRAPVIRQERVPSFLRLKMEQFKQGVSTPGQVPLRAHPGIHLNGSGTQACCWPGQRKLLPAWLPPRLTSRAGRVRI